MKLRSILTASLSVILLSGCAAKENVNQEKNTSKSSKSDAVSLIELVNYTIDFDECLLKIVPVDVATPFDIEYINFKRVSSFKTRVVEANGKQHHVLYFDSRPVALVEDGKRTLTEFNFAKCAKRM